jgi:hypothetical protein
MDEIDRRDMEEWKKIGDFLNARGDHELEEVFRDLARNALIEFSDVADYIWKTPNFIEHERAVEEEKLRDYYPLTGDLEKDNLARKLRTQRWAHESRKLFGLFPSLMASGNLFLSLAMFESYCLRIVKLIEERSSYSLRESQGRGTSRIFAFLQKSGIRHFDLSYASEIQISLRIRNCLIHAEGLLELDKDEKALRRIVKKGRYLSAGHLERRQRLGRAPDEVSIVPSELGDRIKIDNEYPFVVTTYGRDFLIAACTQAHGIYARSLSKDGA